MTKLINTNPLGAIELPLIGRILEANEEFDIDADLACGLLDQEGNYALASGETDPRPAPVIEAPAAPEQPADPTPAPEVTPTPEPDPAPVVTPEAPASESGSKTPTA